jgi:hypothetical protein
MHISVKKAWQLPFYEFHTTNQVVESSLHFIGMHFGSELEAHIVDPCGRKRECNIVWTEMFMQFDILSIL